MVISELKFGNIQIQVFLLTLWSWRPAPDGGVGITMQPSPSFKALRGPGEDYSAVILRLAKA
jgi:hypothetical protein